MNNWMVLFWGSLKRNWTAVLLGIILAVVLSITQSSSGATINSNFSKIKVAYVDKEHSILSKGLRDYLCNDIGVEIYDTASFDEYENDLLNRDISAIIEVPENFYSDAVSNNEVKPVNITTISSYANKAYLTAYINSYLGSASMVINAGCGREYTEKQLNSMLERLNEDSSEVDIVSPAEAVINKNNDIRGFQFVMGFYLNFIFFIGLYVGFMVMSDRINGVFRRIKGTLIRPVQYIAGATGYAFITGMMVNIFFLGYIKFSEIDVGVPLGLCMYLMTMFVIIVIGIALSVSMIVKSKIAVIIYIYGIGCVAALIGGAYFDTSRASESLERVSKLMPHYWVINCIRDYQTITDFNYMPSVVIISLYALLFVLISIILYRRQCLSEE